MKENQLIFGAVATMEFVSGHLEDEETHCIHIDSGYELFEKLQLFYEGKHEELFGRRVFDVSITKITYHASQKGTDFKMVIGTDDSACVMLNLNKQALQDENAQKIAMIRELIDYDPEAEVSLLREKFGK